MIVDPDVPAMLRELASAIEAGEAWVEEWSISNDCEFAPLQPMILRSKSASGSDTSRPQQISIVATLLVKIPRGK